MKKQTGRMLIAMLVLTMISGISVWAGKLDENLPMVRQDTAVLETDGSLSWDETEFVGGGIAEKYGVELLRFETMTDNPASVPNKKTVAKKTTRSLGIMFSYPGAGYYAARINAYDVNGDYSDWTYTDVIRVTRSDIQENHGSTVSENDKISGPGVVQQTVKESGYASGTSAFLPGAGGQGSSLASWKKDQTGYWYQNEDGSYPKSTWKEIPEKSGIYYRFDEKGYMQTGWFYELRNQKWYYLLPSGKMATGWNNINEKWYYFNSDGVMLSSGVHLINGTYYLLDESGARKTNAWDNEGHYYGDHGERVS